MSTVATDRERRAPLSHAPVVTTATAATRWLGDSPSPQPALPTIGRRLLFGRRTVSDALKRAQRYRYLAKECWRLAAVDVSTETRKHYLEMAEHYSALADAEELSTLGHVNGD